jgi:hypothetical protein
MINLQDCRIVGLANTIATNHLRFLMNQLIDGIVSPKNISVENALMNVAILFAAI